MQALLTSAKVKTTIHTLVLCALAVFTFPVVTYAATMPPEVLAAIEANYPDGLPAIHDAGGEAVADRMRYLNSNNYEKQL